MTLYNKDGSVFKLDAPNPAMKNQKLWTGFIAHNMKWGIEISEDKTELQPIQSDFEVKETFLGALDKAKEEEISRKVIVQPDLQKEVISEESSIEKVFIYCLPASLRERQDSLYGETYKTIQYGKPMSFEGVILTQEDLVIEIWTDIDQINQGSILYPKTNFKRWWRVQDKKPKSGGWILTAMPSDYQPSFDG